MKTNLEKKMAGKNAVPQRRGFTLIELLVVISIIALLASFSIPVLKSVKRNQYLKQAQGEMAQLETAIDSYKAAYGFYPPSNSGYIPGNSATSADSYFSPLYYELLGTTNNTTTGTYYTLDGSVSITAANLAMAPAPGPLGVGGFINCNKPGSGEDAPKAKNFLPDLSSKQIGLNITNLTYPAVGVTLLLCSVGGPDLNYKPLSAQGVNPWRYVCPGINNPSSYDLWVQLSISGTTNLICNWSKQIQKNSPLP